MERYAPKGRRELPLWVAVCMAAVFGLGGYAVSDGGTRLRAEEPGSELGMLVFGALGAALVVAYLAQLHGRTPVGAGRVRVDGPIMVCFVLLIAWIISSGIQEVMGRGSLVSIKVGAVLAFQVTVCVVFVKYRGGDLAGVALDGARVVCISGAVLAGLGLLVYWGWIGGVGSFEMRQPVGYARAVGPFGNPNRFGLLAGVVTVTAYTLVLFKVRRWRWFVVLGGMSLVALILSGSRVSMLGAVVGLMISTLMAVRSGPRMSLRGGVVVLVVVLSALGLFGYVGGIETALRLENQQQVRSWEGRMEIAEVSLDLFRQGSPPEMLFGQGHGLVATEFRSSHSGYIRYVVEYGLLFVGMLAFLIVLLVRRIRVRIRPDGETMDPGVIASAWLGYGLVVNLGQTPLFGGSLSLVNFAFIAAVVLVASLPYRRRSTSAAYRIGVGDSERGFVPVEQG